MKKEDLLLSIITPYWKTLDETMKLAKVLIPQLGNVAEWIIVDDGCHEVKLDTLKPKSKVKVIHLEEGSGGASKPRNVGLDKAKGKYIAFIDSDDMVAENYIEQIVNKINTNNFDYCYIGWKSKRWEITGEPPEWNSAVWCRIYKKSIIGNERFNTALVIGEDKDFNDRVIKGERACITEYLYFYNQDAECSLTKRAGKKIHKNAFCFSVINPVGGAETYLYYLAKKYKDYDICVYYQEGDKAQIDRLKKYVHVQKWQGEDIFCEKMFYNYDPSAYIEHVHAKEHIQVFHTDYYKMNMRPCTHPKITGYIGVTKHICKEMKKNFGLDAKLCYNPLAVDYSEDKRRVLKLVSATRLSKEKGKERILKLCKLMDEKNIPYIWTIFTDRENAIIHPNVFCIKGNLNIMQYIKASDYLVQLSDDVEGYGYSVAEALSLGTPVICTDVKAFKEIGVKNNENAIIVDFDLDKVDVEHIYKTCLNFDYTPPEDTYNEILAPGKSQYQENFNKFAMVEAIVMPYFYDVELKQNKQIGEKYIVNRNRAEDLVNKRLCKLVKYIEKEDK